MKLTVTLAGTCVANLEYSIHTEKNQQNATVYHNLLFHIFMNLNMLLDADSVQQPHVQQPYTYAKPEAASAVVGS
jgi:hypothetical protein